jgi:hypothetical protein
MPISHQPSWLSWEERLNMGEYEARHLNGLTAQIVPDKGAMKNCYK